MTTTVHVLQLSNTTIEVSWTTDEADPVGARKWQLLRRLNPPGPAEEIAELLDFASRAFIDNAFVIEAPAVFGDTLDYDLVFDPDGAADVNSAQLVYVDLAVGCATGVVDPLVSTIRYTTLEAVKRRLGIELADTDWDVEITQAVIAGEVAMDFWLGRSFPDECIPGVPSQIRQSAENVGVAIFRGTDSPFGVIGSDDYLGELDVTEVVRREMGRSMLMRGLRVSWGLA